MPGIPPIRVSNTEGTFNQIPVFELEASGATLLKLSPTKVRIAFTGATANTSAIIYAATGNQYLVGAAAADLTGERVVAASDNITITNSGTSFLISADTADISGKQASLNIPLIVGSGGTGRTVAGSATTLVGINSSGSVYDFFSLLASNNATVTRVGTAYYVSATTNAGGESGTVTAGSAGNLAYYPSAGTTVDDLVMGSAHQLLWVNSSGASHEYINFLASDNTTIVKTGTAIFISATTNAGSAGAPSDLFYIVNSASGSLSNELLVTASNNITLTSDANTLWISANTGAGGGGGTQVIEIPMALLTVEVDSGNAAWVANSGGSNLDEAFFRMNSGVQSELTFWTRMPRNLNATPAWNIVIDAQAEQAWANGSNNTILTIDALSVASGESSNGAGTSLVAAGTFALNSGGILKTLTASATNFDGTLATSATDYVKAKITRIGQSDPLTGDLDIFSVNIRTTVDT